MRASIREFGSTIYDVRKEGKRQYWKMSHSLFGEWKPCSSVYLSPRFLLPLLKFTRVYPASNSIMAQGRRTATVEKYKC